MTRIFRRAAPKRNSSYFARTMFNSLCLASIATLSLGAAPAKAAPAATGPAASGAVTETARLNAWLDAKYDEELGFSPIARSFQGDKTDQARIDDLSESASDRRLAWLRKSVMQLKAGFDRTQLSPDGRLSYDLWVYSYEEAARAARFKRNVFVFDQLFGAHTRLAQVLIAAHKVDEPADMDAYVTRIGGIRRGLLQQLDIAKRNAAAGSRVPRFAYETMIRQARTLVTGAPFTGQGDSAIWTDAQAKVDGLLRAGKIDAATGAIYKATARKALLEEWLPAYQAVIAWFESELPKADAVATGVGKNPNGAAYYAAMLASSTTTTLNADEIHRLGIAEVGRIRQEMEALKAKVGFTGPLRDFFKYLREDDRFYYPDTDEGRQAYIEAATGHIAFIRQQLPRYFGILPKAGVTVQRVEAYREIPGGPQEYQMPAADGSRPGVFYIHLADMRAMPIPQLEVVTYHEALPGHHMNYAIAQELRGVPRFRRFLSINAYQEGWGLYSEKLAKEMGAYQDPYSDFGRLTTEMWRAIRLVLDTGLHAKGWTEEQAIAYFLANSPLTEAQIRSEVRRYIVMPGQATGYKIGMIRIEQLRQKAQAKLGARFDIRGFHDVVLGGGQLPLDLLERRVDEWITESCRAGKAAGSRGC
ncbi:DUF885 domain-containing protein [Sphingomonas colocasiae]|uniref:DUF885 domain-containing protein n=1 Tax=Sphingomonas colocasiae TaxID=1848973 RepID=A0ABS7PQ76_9SPHN|nr:DUF885 domain-containing protein [Sphingomonas colocasiae]MBY8823423.1 DUF885 domain-containing protein [Sphingomonas colocasiae]